jgi:hypothetical protein
MAYQDDNNNSLYFIVGGLLVVAIIFGFIFFNPDSKYSTLEPAAGAPQTNITIEKNITPPAPAPAPAPSSD